MKASLKGIAAALFMFIVGLIGYYTAEYFTNPRHAGNTKKG